MKQYRPENLPFLLLLLLTSQPDQYLISMHVSGLTCILPLGFLAGASAPAYSKSWMTTAGAGQRHAEKSSQRQLMRSATEISAGKVEI